MLVRLMPESTRKGYVRTHLLFPSPTSSINPNHPQQAEIVPLTPAHPRTQSAIAYIKMSIEH